MRKPRFDPADIWRPAFTYTEMAVTDAQAPEGLIITKIDRATGTITLTAKKRKAGRPHRPR